MATCYLCVTNQNPTEDPAAIASCTECGVFFCGLDGARHHGTANCYCAMCLVRIVLRGAGVGVGPGPDGGGGLGISVETAREELAVADFERFSAALWDATAEHRSKWRALLAEAAPNVAAEKVGERIGSFVGGREQLEESYLGAPSVDADGAAAAVGVAEHSVRAEPGGSGELDLPGSRQRLHPSSPSSSPTSRS